MPKKKITEANNSNITQTGEQSPIQRNDDLYKRKINPKPAPQPKLGIDVDKEFYDTLIAAAQKNSLDVGKLESFTQISQTRDQIYSLIDTMSEDSTIAAVLETYAEDATETNMDGRIVWATADDDSIAKYVSYLMDTMNVDKNVYGWVYSLIKYGDLYLRLYRESEYNDKLFDDDTEEGKDKHQRFQKINEDLARIMSQNIADGPLNTAEISREEAEHLDDLDEEFTNKDSNSTSILNEDVIVKVFSQNDRYVHYIESVPNPAEVYELTKLGKTYAYIQSPITVSLKKTNDALQYNNRYSYSFKKKDVNLFEATEFVHAALEDNSSRTPEQVDIFLNDNDYEAGKNALSYTVRRGQSLLYSAYKIWRELMLLEYSMLLNRVTKSSIVRVVGVEVGDMPKEQIGPHLQGIKSLMEQKSALNVGEGLSEYTNPGPIENNIYVPTHNQIGSISTQQIGGDVNVSGLDDIDYFKNKLFGALKVPKQYFGFTDDSAGFDGGTSLSIISSRYAKTIKRVQNTLVQALTDAINLMLIDKGLTSYVNKFQLHMVPPTTREEIDRQDAISAKVQLTNDIMQLVASDVKDIEQRLRILRALLDDAVSDPTVSDILQEEIDKYEDLKDQGVIFDENGDVVEPEDTGGMTGTVGGSADFSGGGDIDLGGDFSDEPSSDSSDNSGDLPSPSDLGMDFTENV